MKSVIDETVTLEDKFVRRSGRVFLSGTDALVRLLLVQRERDQARGLNTAGFVSGYRGSPLANYDTALWRAKRHLAEADILFRPGLNEELAATAVWGTQQVNLRPGAKVDGVFAIWYAKGPGVDRAMDAVKHANAAGTASLGGVLAVFGDDHGAQSSTMLHQSEQMFEAAFVPVLNPSDIHEHVTFGLHGFELSRFAGCWVGLKATTEVVETSASIDAGDPPLPVLPTDYRLPIGGLGIRQPDTAADQERRMHGARMEAIAAFARANPIDRQELCAGPARLGIVTTGKAYGDVREALARLEVSEAEAAALGIRLYKVGMSWPLEVTGLSRFADGLEEVLIVEEKRAFIEPQAIAALRLSHPNVRVVGKLDPAGASLLPSFGEFTPSMVANAIVERLRALGAEVGALESRVREMSAVTAVKSVPIARTPFFCSGCPHNSSTKLPEGSRALAGTGCHSMSMYLPDRNASLLTQMGGEGVNWLGQAPFVADKHMFVNLGDGTFSHSGILALRAAAAAQVNATYKILFNDAVAMTGGQENDAHLTVPRIAHLVRAEGAKRVVILSERPHLHKRSDFPAGAEILERRELDRVQRELREITGLTVIIFDQTCAAEKRRRRKRGQYPAAPKRVFINDAVCEACGDCSAQSNCISVGPVETSLGRKRVIDQSSCNADYSCIDGFCPSFVTVADAVVRKQGSGSDHLDAAIAALPMPESNGSGRTSNILVTGIGGTGIVTVGALLGMAAHLEGKAVTTLDFTGLAQKNGAVMSHVRIAPGSSALGSTRIDAGCADLVLACDVVVAASAGALSRMAMDRTEVLANIFVQPPGAFVLDTSLDLSSGSSIAAIRQATGRQPLTIDASGIAVRYMGDTIYANLFMLGYAWQRGAIPLGLDALMQAITLNGAAVPENKRAFALGRLFAVSPEMLEERAFEQRQDSSAQSDDVDAVIADRRRRLVAYQHEAYAAKFDRLVAEVAEAERRLGVEELRLTKAVAKNLYKLMAYKDEYEVARLYSDGDFERKIQAQFSSGGRREIHLAPPLFARRDPATGIPRKIAFGPWMFRMFKLLAKFRGLRGTPFDPFGYTHERREERALIVRYEEAIRGALDRLGHGNFDTLLALAELPDSIRGFGHIKARNMAAAETRWSALMAELNGAGPAKTTPVAERQTEMTNG